LARFLRLVADHDHGQAGGANRTGRAAAIVGLRSAKERCLRRAKGTGLRAGSTIKRLTRLQAGLVRVIGNVASQIVVLLRAPHQMVERFPLPELTAFADRLIDPYSV
jgi:hypothetical protein